MTKRKWTKESCYQAALECTCRSEFKTKYGAAFRISYDNQWINDYTWFKKLYRKWDYDACYNIALKCTSRVEFSKNIILYIKLHIKING